MSIPRPEYPRPQFVRGDWLNLNGTWEFEIDSGDSGLDRGLAARKLSGEITVPFCPESTLSGVVNTDFLSAVWYRRTVTIPSAWAGRRVILHFQAVDYDATVWVNGAEMARHRGGFTPFSADLTSVAPPGSEATIVVRARDPHRRPMPLGKQSFDYANAGCLYTRTTGIWQTVWLEPVGRTFLQRPRITPDLGGGRFIITQPIAGDSRAGHRVRAVLRDKKGPIASAFVPADSDFAVTVDLVIPKERQRHWRPGDPFLYDIEIELLDAGGAVVDRAECYAGLRSMTIDGPAIKLNGETVFQRLVLDQGYYADGILTAPSDAALVRDIELSMAVGFNGARLHQKVFEERFLYHADRLGYLVWGEFPDWGCEMHAPPGNNQQPTATYITQWLEVIARDFSHPSIIGWCPLNETYQNLHDRITTLDEITHGMFLATKAMDPTRPVLDTSGYSHRVEETDVYDSHDYEQDPAKFAIAHAAARDGRPFVNKGQNNAPWSIAYRGQPFFVSEFGGIWWNPDAKPGEDSWGYGNRPKTIDEFYERFAGLCDVLLNDPSMFGYCYTQLTDVFQEQNGIFRFDRTAKFDLDRLKKVQERKAAIE